MAVHHSIHQMGFISTISKNMRCICNLFGWSMEEFVSGLCVYSLHRDYRNVTLI